MLTHYYNAKTWCLSLESYSTYLNQWDLRLEVLLQTKSAR
jgi:hypothetical protein